MTYIDVIRVVTNEQGHRVAYCAWSSGVKDAWGGQTWETNMEFPLADVERRLGYKLEDGIDYWARIDNWS